MLKHIQDQPCSTAHIKRSGLKRAYLGSVTELQTMTVNACIDNM